MLVWRTGGFDRVVLPSLSFACLLS